MNTVFNPPPQVTIPVDGSPLLYPVRRVFCIGRNYAAHAREMGRDPDREPPFFFTKWAETVLPGSGTIPYPTGTSSYHYEAELVVAMAGGGRAIAAGDAMAHVFGFAVGLDMTRRDLQLAARELGRPWDTGKNVEGSAPVGRLVPAAQWADLERAALTLTVNGEVRQSADLAEMIWPVPDLIAEISRLYALAPGDLIFTGTPAGVGAVLPGDELVLEITGLPRLEVTIGDGPDPVPPRRD